MGLLLQTEHEYNYIIWDYEHSDRDRHQPRDIVRAVINKGLTRWKKKKLVADNIAVLIAFPSEGEEQTPTIAGIRSLDEPTTSSNTTSLVSEKKNTTSGSTASYKKTYADEKSSGVNRKRPDDLNHDQVSPAKKVKVDSQSLLNRLVPNTTVTESPTDKPLADSGYDTGEDHVEIPPLEMEHASSGQSQ